jgi:hypothetical protein
MNPNHIKSWIDVVQELVTLAARLIGGFWAWSRFVVERGLIPPSQMDLALRTIGSSESATIVEIAVRLHNKGSSALVVTDLRARLRYLNDDDDIEVIDEPEKAAFGRVSFPHARNESPTREYAIATHAFGTANSCWFPMTPLCNPASTSYTLLSR